MRGPSLLFSPGTSRSDVQLKLQGKYRLPWELRTGSLGILDAEMPKITNVNLHVVKERRSVGKC